MPTRNRQEYAKQTVRFIANISDKIQIIVNDNSDNDELKRSLADLIERGSVEYHFIPERISAVDNYENAVSYVTGEFFCAIGDDDIVLPNIIECIEWMNRNGIDIVKGSKKQAFFWPTKQRKWFDGRLQAYSYTADIKLCEPRKGIEKLLRNGGMEYDRFEIAGSYHYLLRTNLVHRVRKITGCFYGGCSPDMYSAVCLSLLPDIKLVEIDYPITLPGLCPASTSADSVRGKHFGKLENAPQFIGMKQAYKWDERIPKIYAVETIWCETLFKAMDAMGEGELIDKFFNRRKFINSLYYNNGCNAYILKHLHQNDLRLLQEDKSKKVSTFRKYAAYLMGIIRGQRFLSVGLNNIEQAQERLCQHIAKHNKGGWKRILDSKI